MPARASRRSCEEVVASGALPLVLGGDHSIALGTLAGLRAAAGQPGGVIWIDAHGDLNTPASSPSGNVHGMPLAAALGLAGTRSPMPALTLPAVDPEPRRAARRSLARSRRARADPRDGHPGDHDDRDRPDRHRARDHARRSTASPDPGFVHVSLDLDALDPEVAPGVGTPVKGGLTYREAHLACEDLAESGVVGSLELVEVNPILDRENGSAAIAVELAASALGQSIL